MKSIFTFAALFIPISLLLLHSNSYTTAQIRSETALSIVTEDRALIAITYGNGKRFSIKNNTGEAIELQRVDFINKTDHEIIHLGEKDSPIIQPGGVKEFNISGDPKKLPGKSIQIIAQWKGGRAELTSTLPEF